MLTKVFVFTGPTHRSGHSLVSLVHVEVTGLKRDDILARTGATLKCFQLVVLGKCPDSIKKSRSAYYCKSSINKTCCKPVLLRFL